MDTKPALLTTSRIMRKVWLIPGLLLLGWAAPGEASANVVFENANFRYTISAGGTNLAFVDRISGTNFLYAATASPCALVQTHGATHAATAATLSRGRLTLRFGDSGIKAVLKTESRPSHIAFTVESVSGAEVDALTFLNVPLTLKGSPGESFGACALSLNLITRVDALPALQSGLKASCEKKFGLIGAKAAIVAAPMAKILPTLQAALSSASELPVCKVAGPWAREIPFNHGSYLFNFGSLTETNVADWIEMTRSLGFTQIDNHGGGAGFFRFGDMELNRQKWPDGWESQRRIVDKLHTAGIGSIFHTYAFFIDKQSKYVTPVPDPRLDAFRTFTLAEPLTPDATEITVNESTAEIKTITGFFEPNSVVLHIGDELVTFGGASKAAPWKFTGVKRGAFATKAAAHERGAKARHLKEMFGLFVPNVDTTLFEEIAANHAAVVNYCGFDGIYLDAIDGSSILRGGDECWFWADKFVVEIQKRLKKPIGMEMSAMWHHFWQYRTRWQAWDFPRRGQKRFIDQHAADVNGGLLLPLHLGWWGFWSFDPPQIEPSYPDVIEHLGARLIGWDAGISLTAGVNRDALRKTPLFQRAVDTLRVCEELRHANVFDEAAKAKLREPGSEFALVKNVAGKTRFRRIQSQSQTVALAEPWTLAWRVTNAFAAQPTKFRIEALMSAAPLNETNSTLVADLGKEASEFWKRTNALGISFNLKPATEAGGSHCALTATNAGKVARNAAWVRLEKHFEPLLNIKDGQALAVEVEGDGSGAVLAFRIECPSHIAYGAVADRYVTLDFTGRRQFTLVETESTRWSDYVWNDNKHLYHTYRETVNFGAIDSFSVWLQNLPAGRETKVSLSPIRTLPLRATALTNPKITVEGKPIEFPVKLASGSWIEANGPDDCTVYGAKGESLGKVTPRGDWPMCPLGVSVVTFSSEPGDGPQPRARIVVFNQGDEL
ncbi:MAG: hypothetical protein EXS35_14365 [Pedosphaera sp.]|nr:hypothetical protein [Pedosphaera sp.]